MRDLGVGETANDLRVDASKRWNHSGLLLQGGKCYEFKVEDVKDWRDADIPSSPQKGHLEQKWWLEKTPLKWLRRSRKDNWYTLVGSIGTSSSGFFLIGKGRTYTPETTGELFSFANDVRWLDRFYRNNHGTLRLTVTRLR